MASRKIQFLRPNFGHSSRPLSLLFSLICLLRSCVWIIDCVHSVLYLLVGSFSQRKRLQFKTRLQPYSLLRDKENKYVVLICACNLPHTSDASSFEKICHAFTPNFSVSIWSATVCDRSVTQSPIGLRHISDIWKHLSPVQPIALPITITENHLTSSYRGSSLERAGCSLLVDVNFGFLLSERYLSLDFILFPFRWMRKRDDMIGM